MKIQKVIHSTNSNNLYLDFWPIVSKVWSLKFNIQPILLYVNDKDVSIDNTYGDVIKFDPIKNIPIELQSLWIRYWYTSQEPDTIFMISDIDMIPLSTYYFIDKISSISDDKYIHLNPCIETYGLIPSCYHIAKGRKFTEILKLADTFEVDIKKIINFDKSYSNGWFNDEKYATNCILSSTDTNIILLPREDGQNGRRIDRTNWKYDIDLVKANYYFDAHSIRPYENYKSEIDKLVNITLEA